MLDRLKLTWVGILWWWQTFSLVNDVLKPIAHCLTALFVFVCAIPIGLILLGFLTTAFIGYFLYNLIFLFVGALAWAKEHVYFPMFGTALGIICASYMKEVGVIYGAGYGFFMGLIFELMRYLDFQETGTTMAKNTFFEGVYGGSATTYGPYKKQQQQEKPWTWRGFQVDEGPREDDIRLDRN